MKILVIGGSGFLGHHIVNALLAEGHHVTVLVRRPVSELPESVTVRLGDFQSLSETDLEAHLAGHTGVVFAAGISDAPPPRTSASAFFARANVEPVVKLLAAARRAGCASGVIMGSYFVTLSRMHPELRLAERSPYIQSRIDQAEMAHRAAGDGFSVAVLEIPYVAGAAPGRKSVLDPLVRQACSRFGPLVPSGGTAVVSATALARAVVRALEQRANGDFPLVSENLTWTELLQRLTKAAGHQPKHVWSLRPSTLLAVGRAAELWQRLRRVEPGLDPVQMSELFSRNLFVDTSAGKTLDVGPDDLDQALTDTVKSALANVIM